MNEKRNFDYERLHPFKWYILENFPFLEDSIDVLTNYQLFCKLGEMYNKEIDAINTLGIQVEGITDWFDNLDVQDEVNNKLDEMAESGELQEIIAEYIRQVGIISFNTVSDMVASENLINGSTCKTLGYYAINDGGGATYKIRTITNEDTIDNTFLYAITNSETLVAELLYDFPINVLTLGVKNDKTSDISTKINNATIKGDLFFPDGHYLVENEIIVENSLIGATNHRAGIRDNDKGSILFSNITCNYANKETKAVLNVSNFKQVTNIEKIAIKLHDYECGIKGTNINSNNFYITDVSVSNVKSTGIYLQGSKSKVADLNNITIVGTGESFEDSTGLYVNFPDYKVNNLDVMACRKGCKFGGFVQGSNYHIWCGSIQGGDGILNHTEDHSWFKGTEGIAFNYSLLDNIYIDTCYNKIKTQSSNNPNVKTISNLITVDDNSMNAVENMAGKNFDVGCQIVNHVNYVTNVNKTNAFSDDVNYKNETVILYIPESDYFAQNKVGGTKYYDVRYKFTKNITGTSNDIIEIAKVKVENNVGGCVDINVLHIRNRPHKITLKFINGAYTGGSFESYGQTDEKCYITSTKDANNIYKVYLKVNNRGDEYLSVGSDYNYKWSGVNVLDLGYRTGENHAFNPETLSSTTNLTEIT